MAKPRFNTVPLGDIDDLSRQIAVAWVENFKPIGGIELNQKHKLASDIMNYGKRKNKEILRLLKQCQKVLKASPVRFKELEDKIAKELV